MQAKLVVVGGRANKKEVALRLPFSIGRSDDANLTIEHRAISRQHCELFERDGHLVLRDVGSANGTYVDDRQITGEQVLDPGGTFTIGPLTFRAVYELPATKVEPITEQPAAGATLIEEEAATPFGDSLGLPDEESELDSFDLELSDEIEFPEIARDDVALTTGEEGISPAADAGAAELGLSGGDNFEDLRLDDDLDSESLSLPLDIDEPLPSDVPHDLEESLDLDALESEDLSAAVGDETLASVPDAASSEEEPLDFDMELALEEEPSETASAAPPVIEDDDSPTEIGEFVDLRAEDSPTLAETSAAIPDEFQEVVDVPDDLLAEIDVLEEATASRAEPATPSASEEKSIDVELRDFSDSSHVDDAPSQELFTVDDEEEEVAAAPPSDSSEVDDEATPWLDLEDELPLQSEEPVEVAPATDALAAESPAVEPTEEKLRLEDPMADDVAAQETFESEPAIESPEVDLPLAVDFVEEDALTLEEPADDEFALEELSQDDAPKSESSPETHVVEELSISAADEDDFAVEELARSEEVTAPESLEAASPVEETATTEPDFTAWMFEESLASNDEVIEESAAVEDLLEPLALDDELPALDPAEHDENELPSLTLDDSVEIASATDDAPDSNALPDVSLPVEAVEDELQLLDFSEMSDDLPVEVASQPVDETTGADDPVTDELPLEEFQLEDSVEDSEEIEFGAFDLEESESGEDVAAKVNDEPLLAGTPELELPTDETAPTPLTDDLVSFDDLDEFESEATLPDGSLSSEVSSPLPLDSDSPMTESLEAPATEEVNFDDWMASEMVSRPATPVDEEAASEAFDEPSFPPLDEPVASAADEADEIAFDEAPIVFDEAPALEDDVKSDEEFNLDEEFSAEELSFDDDTSEPGGRQKLELPAVFEEASPLELESAKAEASAAAIELPPTDVPKAKRSWWPFGRGKRDPKPAKPANAPKAKKKKASQTLDATASLPTADPLPGDAFEMDEIEFSLDDAPEVIADAPRFDEPAETAEADLECLSDELPGFQPTDPLDELDFPLDDGGTSLTAHEPVEVEPAETEAIFDEPVFEDQAPVDDGPATSELAATAEADDLPAFSMDDDDEPMVAFDEEPAAMSVDEDEPEITFDELEPLADTTTAATPVFEEPLPPEPAEKSATKRRSPKKSPAESTEKPRRRWWPFGGKKQDKPRAADTPANKPGRAAKDSRGTLSLDDLSAPDEVAFVDESDSERISRRLSHAPRGEEELPTFDEGLPTFEDVALEDTPSPATDEIVLADSGSPPVFAIDEEAESSVLSLDDDEVPAFELDDELPEFEDDSDAAPTTNPSRAASGERGASADESWGSAQHRSNAQSERRPAPQDAEDDWDHFLKSFDS